MVYLCNLIDNNSCEYKKKNEKNMRIYVSELIHWNSVAVINTMQKITSDSNHIS